MANKSYSLAHTKWMCKYHIVFTPKYRRKIIYNKYREDLIEIMRTLCKYKGVEIIEGHMMPDHVHMLVAIPPRISVSSFMGYLKGKSALMMFERHANLKYKFGNRHFRSLPEKGLIRITNAMQMFMDINEKHWHYSDLHYRHAEDIHFSNRMEN